MAITIDFLANAKGFLRGTSDVEGALDDVASSLDDVAKDSARSADKLAGDYKDAARDLEQSNTRLERSFKDLADTQKTSTKQVANDFDISSRQQTDRRKEAIKEIGAEAKANAAETFSSFDGSASSFADGIQGTLGGLVSSLGPVGLAAGAAGAIAIGLITGALQNADTTSQEFRASVGEMTADLITSGQVGKVSVGYILDQLKKLATESDSSKVSLDKIFETSKKAGNSAKDLAQAYAGNTEGLKDLLSAGRDKLEQDKKTADLASTQLTQASQARSAAADAVADLRTKQFAQGEYNTYLEQAAAKAAAAAQQEKQFILAGGPELVAKAALIEQLNTAYDDAAGGVQDYIDKESGIFDTAGYIAAMQTRQQALRDYQETLAKSPLSADAKTFLEAQGQDSAATFLAGYKNATPAQQAALNAIWSEAGRTSSGTYAAALTAGIPSTIPGPRIVPTVDFSAITSFRDLAVKPLTVPVYLAAPRAGSRTP